MKTDQNYNVEDFINRVKHLDRPQMIKETKEAKSASAADDSFNFSRVKLNFANRLDGFLWFLEHESLRADISMGDIALFKSVAEILVENKQMREDVLRVFEGKF